MQLVAYPVYVIILNVSTRRRQCLINNGHPLVRFLLKCHTQEQLKEKEGVVDEEMSAYGFTSSTTVSLESGVQITADSVGRERRMRILQEALKALEGPLQKCKL